MKLEKQARARLDLVECLEYMESEAGPAVAQRFAENIEIAFSQICTYPEIGEMLPVRKVYVAGLRHWNGVKGFPKYQIFYQIQRERDTVVIVRFGHIAQDWLNALRRQ